MARRCALRLRFRPLAGLAAKDDDRNNSLIRDSTTDQGNSQCLWVTVTTTFCPATLYSPPNIPCEKRPDRPSPTRVAPFSLATLLALASSEDRSAVVRMLKVLATALFLPCSCERSDSKIARALRT